MSWTGAGREVCVQDGFSGLYVASAKEGSAQLGLLTGAPTGDLSGVGVSGYLNFLLSVQGSHREYLKRPGKKESL